MILNVAELLGPVMDDCIGDLPADAAPHHIVLLVGKDSIGEFGDFVVDIVLIFFLRSFAHPLPARVSLAHRNELVPRGLALAPKRRDFFVSQVSLLTRGAEVLTLIRCICWMPS